METTSTVPPPLRKQKLKLSCDTCSKLKVKCPKQMPSCERCRTKGQECVYSSARRYGKRKREDRLKADNHVSRFFLPSPETRIPRHWPGAPPRMINGNELTFHSSLNAGPTLLPTPTIENCSYPSLPTPVDNFSQQLSLWSSEGDVLPSIEASNTNRYSDNNGMDVPAPYSPLQYPYLSNDSWMLDAPAEISDDSSSSTATTATASMSGSYSSSKPSSSSSISSSRLTRPENCSLSSSATSISTRATSQDPSDNIATYPHTLNLTHSNTTYTQDCFERVCNLLKDTERPISSPTTCPFNSCPSSSQQISIESVLEKTDRAIDHISSLVDCPCSKTRTTVRGGMRLVLHEIVGWYELIVRQLHLQQSSTQPQPIYPFSSAENTRGVHISISALVVAGLKIDAADALSIVSNLVLLRVKRVRTLVADLTPTTGCVASTPIELCWSERDRDPDADDRHSHRKSMSSTTAIGFPFGNQKSDDEKSLDCLEALLVRLREL